MRAVLYHISWNPQISEMATDRRSVTDYQCCRQLSLRSVLLTSQPDADDHAPDYDQQQKSYDDAFACPNPHKHQPTSFLPVLPGWNLFVHAPQEGKHASGP